MIIREPFDFWTHISLVTLFSNDGRLEDAQAHIEQAKPYTTNNPYHLARVMQEQTTVWRKQSKLEEARSEALRAANAFEELGATRDAEECREFLQGIQKELDLPVLSG